jgi:pilus assembly protein Flp/PilA
LVSTDLDNQYQSLERTFKMKLINAMKDMVSSFARDEDGSQVVEYALIIAVVSIAMVVALSALVANAPMSGFISRVNTCLTSTTAGSCK